ncbi:hypothetical protein EDB89DRAFT_2068196 [Lactarius sanguifluus]|nr:hypothetical protein EDB89DRAFT_2068196 [Lactarius sanguifluus]
MSKGLLPSLYQVSTNLLPNNCDIYDIYSLYHHYRNFWGGPGFADLYATLFEWRTGEQRTMEFSANTFLDVYLGHVNTLNHICENRAGMYHLMMADIFSLASTNANLSGNPIAELDLGALEN